MFTMGHILGTLGAAFAIILSGIGSAMGVSRAGQAVAGVTAENPKIFTKAMILQLLPATQGIYGFIVSFMITQKLGLGGTLAEISTAQGWGLFVAALPVAIVGFFSALYQAKASIGGINLLAKQSDALVKGMLMSGVVETYAVFALLISIFLIG